MKKGILLFLCVAVFAFTSMPSLAQNKYILKANQAMTQSPLFELYGRDASGALAVLGDAQDCDSFIAGSRCRLADNDLPGVFSQPGDLTELIFQPGADAVVVAFTAPTTGAYQISYVAQLLDQGSTGVEVGEGFGSIAAPNVTPIALLLPAVQKIREAATRMRAGDAFFLSFTSIGAPTGDPAFDRISVSMTVAQVPEPASWAMLIAGFGLIGAAMRRRRMVPASA
jgi:PEP-CTERM motif